MKRVFRSAAFVVAALLSGAALPANAQAVRHVQLGGGIQYPLVSQQFDVQQALGYHARVGFRIKDNLWASGVYEMLTTQDDLKRKADVDIKLYGVSVDYLFQGDEGLRLFVTGAVGKGTLDWANPGPSVGGRPDGTDLNLWYEAGGGLRLGKSDRWSVRFALTYRRLSPDKPSALLTGGRGEVVPSVDFLWRF